LTPITSDTIHWGILAPGNIAHQFADGLKATPGAKLLSVGSRSREKADAFADKYDAPKRHASYEALAADPDVHVIYIATPHPGHKEAALLCLAHGKAVLCEKPFTVNAKEAEEVIQSARAKDLFLMEAMWSRFFPAMAHVRKLLNDGAIGEPLMLQADFGFRAGVDPNSRLFSPALAGGGLLDVGVYPVSLSSMIFGTPSQIAGVAKIGETGVDELAAMSLLHPGGQVSSLTTGIRVNTPQEATILGSEGSIKLHAPWWKLAAITLNANGKSEEIALPYDGPGMNFEATEVGNCLRAGKTESDILPLDETLSIMKTLDTLRAQWGLKYPME
jgi:predicted dehydrogenase